MKIAFVYDAVYPWVKGGAEKRIYEFGKRLAESGNEVHIFGIKWWDGNDIIRNEGMTLHGVCGAMDLYVNGRRSIREAVIFSIKLIPHLFREKFDVIDVSAFPYFSCFSVKFISILRRTPMIITWHEVWGNYWYDYLGWKGFFGRFVERFVSKLTCRSIVVSEMTKKGLQSLGTVAQISIVPNGIDLEEISSISRSIHDCDMIFVGRLIKEKNVDLLLEVVDHLKNTLPEIKFNIIGEGPEKERLKKQIIERNLESNVNFFGFMGYNDVIARIKSSKILVLLSRREGFGLVVIEAFACGVPVVTIKSPQNAASELVKNSTGFVVNHDVKELADAIYKLITDSALHERMSMAAFNKAQDYEWNNIVEQLMVIYKEPL